MTLQRLYKRYVIETLERLQWCSTQSVGTIKIPYPLIESTQMMLVDFKEDFKNQIEFELKTFGSCYDESLDVATNFFILLNKKRRIPDVQPREIYYAKTFSIPEERQKGFNILVEKILRGDDLRPYLSGKLNKKIGKLSQVGYAVRTVNSLII
jgi:hypothetical protein